ncbi:HNH endonuclease signature motif containing protein [Vibrio parahaemolyticus]|uniref:HNH endonuclease signature motif containing protein n=1 Tax=Vibrio parahaemolyticus TaxID=670 RepID=UPI001124A75C|nr:HNH endonuclease signature motif containing protein [Vibrio parahaemolyticus]TOJ45325.1 hypothetical protein CGI38_15940 [Vibrio parahaemolyticus]HCE2591072.1 HNH endonuclease [Vibrio parahaemolyticus]
MATTQADIKKLFGLSAGQCNICKKSVIEDEVVIGEIAHIIAKSSNGPRGETNQPRDDSYENLILLCSKDHKIVDSQPLKYPADYLRNVKSQHEANIERRLNKNGKYEKDLKALNLLFEVIPILSLRNMAMYLPHKLPSKFAVTDAFEFFCRTHPHLYEFRDQELTRLWKAFMSTVEEIEDFTTSNISKDKIYPLGTFQDNQQCFNIYVPSDYYKGFVVMNKRHLTVDQIAIVEETIAPLVQLFIFSHTALVDYIRYNFEDICWD